MGNLPLKFVGNAKRIVVLSQREGSDVEKQKSKPQRHLVKTLFRCVLPSCSLPGTSSCHKTLTTKDTKIARRHDSNDLRKPNCHFGGSRLSFVPFVHPLCPLW